MQLTLLGMSGRSRRVGDDVARQISPFCAAQLAYAEGAAVAPNGGYRSGARVQVLAALGRQLVPRAVVGGGLALPGPGPGRSGGGVRRPSCLT